MFSEGVSECLEPLIEKRFSQLKTDFAAAPVYLKNATRIQGLLAIYVLVLLTQTLEGFVDDDTCDYVIPTLAVDAKGNIGLGCTRSSETEFPSAYVMVHGATDPKGTMRPAVLGVRGTPPIRRKRPLPTESRGAITTRHALIRRMDSSFGRASNTRSTMFPANGRRAGRPSERSDSNAEIQNDSPARESRTPIFARELQENCPESAEPAHLQSHVAISVQYLRLEGWSRYWLGGR